MAQQCLRFRIGCGSTTYGYELLLEELAVKQQTLHNYMAMVIALQNEEICLAPGQYRD